MNKLFYRFLCLLLLFFVIYFIVSWGIVGEIDEKSFVFLIFSVAILVLVTAERKKSYDIFDKQEKELLMYKLYTKPLEELVREIRMKQHEFDNHMNAILNMHMTIKDYDELVAEQSKYVKELYDDRGRQFLSLLKISDKVLAGFIYSKAIAAKEFIRLDLHVQGKTMLTKASEHDLIEVVGTLIDNAMEACDETNNQIKMFLGSENDRTVFEIWNQHPVLTIEEIGRFFEKGYTTKGDSQRRGIGLYNARHLTQLCGGSLTVGMETMEGESYICFKVEM